MPQHIEVNGQVIEFPDGMAASDIESAIKKNMLSIPAKSSVTDDIKQGIGNLAAGTIRGARCRCAQCPPGDSRVHGLREMRADSR